MSKLLIIGGFVFKNKILVSKMNTLGAKMVKIYQIEVEEFVFY